jgi:hypothetical protein
LHFGEPGVDHYSRDSSNINRRLFAANGYGFAPWRNDKWLLLSLARNNPVNIETKLDLGYAAIDVKLGARDIAGLIGCEE